MRTSSSIIISCLLFKRFSITIEKGSQKGTLNLNDLFLKCYADMKHIVAVKKYIWEVDVEKYFKQHYGNIHMVTS